MKLDEMTLDVSQSVSVRIVDANGKIVRSWNEKVASGLYTRNIDTRDLSTGTYFLNILSELGSSNKAFNVQH